MSIYALPLPPNPVAISNGIGWKPMWHTISWNGNKMCHLGRFIAWQHCKQCKKNRTEQPRPWFQVDEINVVLYWSIYLSLWFPLATCRWRRHCIICQVWISRPCSGSLPWQMKFQFSPHFSTNSHKNQMVNFSLLFTVGEWRVLQGPHPRRYYHSRNIY